MQRNLTFLLLAVTVLFSTRPDAFCQDAALTVVVNPQTGDTILRNDSGSAINIDGYLFKGQGETFDPATWASLESAATEGWQEGQATGEIISEVSLQNSLSVPAGAELAIGAPYRQFSPSAIGEAEPEFTFDYSVADVGVFAGSIEFAVDNNIVLVVNPNTGEAVLENQSIFDVNIDSYIIQSSRGVINSGGWAPLADSVGGWAATPGSATRIGEGNLEGSTLFSAGGGSMSLGTPIDPTALSDESDLFVQFSVAAQGEQPGVSLVGSVLFDPPTRTTNGGGGFPGDYNDNGTVEQGDLDLVLLNWGEVTPPIPNNWTNDLPEGAIDQGDLDGVLLNWGNSAATLQGAAVPEPASVILLAIAAIVAGFRCRRR